MLIYVFYHAAKPDQSVYLFIEGDQVRALGTAHDGGGVMELLLASRVPPMRAINLTSLTITLATPFGVIARVAFF